MAWPGNRVQQMIIAKLSLRLSLNKPSNILWQSSKEICHRTAKREREKERKKARKRASERVGCQMLWQLQETEQVEFPSLVLPGPFNVHNSIWSFSEGATVELVYRNIPIWDAEKKCPEWIGSVFTGKSTRDHGFLPLNMGVSCQFSRKSIQWRMVIRWCVLS